MDQVGHAWVITQSFALSAVVAQTAVECSAESNAYITNIYSVLCDVAHEPRFVFTIGGNARFINAIYRTRLLEEHVAELGY